MSNAERQKRYRERNAPLDETVTRDVTGAPLSVTRVTPAPESVTRNASLEDCQANPQNYAKRAKPEALNWGPWMSADELAKARLSANRVPILGDWDYAGVAVHESSQDTTGGPRLQGVPCD